MDAYTKLPPATRALLLYAATLVLEIPVVLLRVTIVWATAAILLFATGHTTVEADNWALLGAWPTLWSITALIPPWSAGRNSHIAVGCVLAATLLAVLTGHTLLTITILTTALSVLVSPWATGWWWQTRVGGREPSTKEREAYEDTINILQHEALDHPLPQPHNWFVLDTPDPEAAVCGHTLMLTRPLLDSPHLPAGIPHELGHMAALDARMAAALNRLIIHPLREPHPDQERYKRQTEMVLTEDPVTQTIITIGLLALIAKTILRACRGGLGLWLLQPLWGTQWRSEEYAADQYAASLGQADELADFLQTHTLIYDRPLPFAWLHAHTHPPTELRIDRLRASAAHAPDTRHTASATPAISEAA